MEILAKWKDPETGIQYRLREIVYEGSDEVPAFHRVEVVTEQGAWGDTDSDPGVMNRLLALEKRVKGLKKRLAAKERLLETYR